MNAIGPTEREKTAYHEAGHAVVAWRLDVIFESISIKQDATSFGRGIVDFGNKVDAIGPTYCAGMVAECLFQGFEPHRKYLQDTQDLEILEERGRPPSFSNNDWDVLLKGWVLMAHGILFCDEWPRTEALARELLIHEELTGETARQIIENSPQRRL